MSQPNLLRRAKQGDADAIAALMNLTLQDKGVAATVVRIQDYLHISFRAANSLNQATLTEFARQGLERLAVESIQTVKVYGLKTHEELPNWVTTFQLGTDSPEPEPRSKPHTPWAFVVELDRVIFQPLHDRWAAALPAVQTSIPRLKQTLTTASAKGQTLLGSVRSQLLKLPAVRELLPPGISITSYVAIASVVTVAAFLVGGMVAGIAISHGAKATKSRSLQAANAIAKPSQSILARQQTEVKQYLSKMVEAQKLFYQQNQRLAKNLEELERSAAVVSHSYSYTYRAAALPTQFQLVAGAKSPGLKSYSAIVVLDSAATSAAITASLCETNQPTQVPPISSEPQVSAPRCPSGSSKVE